jgi:transposase
MAKALSTDLRRRVVDASTQGMSCRQAAERFGVSASSAIRWQQQVRTTGTIEPRTQGGDRRSKRIEAHSQVILGLVAETPDITLVGIRARLADRGVRVGMGTLWRFFDRHRITRKKRPPTRRNRTAPIS